MDIIIETNLKQKIKIQKNTILIGPNGSGKTSFLNQINNLKKIKNIKINNEDVEIEVIDVLNEKINVDTAKSNYNEYVKLNFEQQRKKFNNDIKKLFKNKIKLNDDLKKYKEEINKIYKDFVFQPIKDEVFYKQNINLSIKCKEIDLYDLNPEFTSIIFFDNYKYENISKLPSGVRKLIEFYVSTKINKNNDIKKLLLLDEIDNFLHPNYINLISKIIIKLFEDKKYLVMISTHNPELLFLLNEYIKYLAIPKLIDNKEKKYYEINYIDLDLGFEEYKNFPKSTISKKVKKMEEYLEKVKSRFSIQFTRLMFSGEETTIICEGITDQMFFKKFSDFLIINSFGNFNFPIYISLYYSLYKNYNNLRIVADLDEKDEKDEKEESNTKKMKKYLEEKFTLKNVLYFKNDLEHDIFNSKKNNLNSSEKFEILTKFWNKSEFLIISDKLKYELKKFENWNDIDENTWEEILEKTELLNACKTAKNFIELFKFLN